MTRRVLQVVTLIAALLAPTAAFAEHYTPAENVSQGPIAALLAGPVLDAYATTLEIVPPTGATAMVTRGGKAIAFLSRPGHVPMKDNATYSVAVIKGKTLIYNQSIIARPGRHAMVWTDDASAPQLSFTPYLSVVAAPVYGAPVYGAPVYGPPVLARGMAHEHAHQPELRTPATPPTGESLSVKRFERVRKHMAMLPNDGLRKSVLKPWTARATFSKAQAADLLDTFATRSGKLHAARMLSARIK